MNTIILTGKINGMWKNGLHGEKRGLNILIVDYANVFKTTVWQEEADWVEESCSIGDEIQLTGECSGVWKNAHGGAIELRKTKVISVNSTSLVMKELKYNYGEPNTKNQKKKKTQKTTHKVNAVEENSLPQEGEEA